MKICYVQHYMRVRSLGVVYLGGSGSGSLVESYSTNVQSNIPLSGSQQSVENSWRWEYQTTLPASWETCMQVKKQQLEPDMEQQTSSELGKEEVNAVYIHHV